MKTEAYYDCLDMHMKSMYISVWLDELWEHLSSVLLEFVFVNGGIGLNPNLYTKAHNLLDEGI